MNETADKSKFRPKKLKGSFTILSFYMRSLMHIGGMSFMKTQMLPQKVDPMLRLSKIRWAGFYLQLVV